jgi:hypothetical protein
MKWKSISGTGIIGIIAVLGVFFGGIDIITNGSDPIITYLLIGIFLALVYLITTSFSNLGSQSISVRR